MVLNMEAEATTTEVSKEKNPQDFDASKHIAPQGSQIAGNTRKEIEERTGKSAESFCLPNSDQIPLATSGSLKGIRQ